MTGVVSKFLPMDLSVIIKHIMAVPIFREKDFFIIGDKDIEILIEDIFYSKNV